MRKVILYSILIFLFSFKMWSNVSMVPTSHTTIEDVFESLYNEVNNAINKSEVKLSVFQKKMNAVSRELNSSQSLTKKINLMLLRENLKDSIKLVSLNKETEVSKIRYIKGLQILKILYEKNLALDHHFTSMKTLSEVNNMVNPNTYPEFIKTKSLLTDSRKRGKGFTLSEIMNENIYTSVIHTFISLFNNQKIKASEKKEEMLKIECILDFTFRMNNDLDIIYFESVFLKKNNEEITSNLEKLFKEYTSPIGYTTSLSQCRLSDDWASIVEKLNAYINKLESLTDDNLYSKKIKVMQIDIKFPVDRLLQFINQYNIFINQSAKFYEKFGIMLSSYENEEQCAENISKDYLRLKKNITATIEKFNTAYKPIEINGSKLKQALYGISEYD
jgi:hypothetical protein